MESELVQFEDGFEVGEKDPDGKKFDKGKMTWETYID